jgi:hypothetical protein
MKKSAPTYIANFDSAAAMVRATANFLNGQDFPALGLGSALKPLANLVNLTPEKLRDQIYALGGGNEAIPARKLNSVSAERISQWITSEYPQRPYPAVMIGSSNGAAVHLCAALGIPWLPQTKLIPVRRTGIHPDEMVDDFEWGKQHAADLLDANPELQLHHMADPNQDRLMIQYMTYFRTKRLRLGETYERFVTENLEPGGTLFLLECEKKWPTVRVGERHLFQPGAVGGLEPEEYLHGSERVAEYLARYDSHRRKWDPPEPDGESPEAEWGFEPALREDVERFAAEHGFRIRRIVFEEPEDMSPLVADLYRWWYRERRMVANRLLGSSFIVMEPWWAMRTGSVPFWCKFNVETSADALEAYLDSAEPFDETNLMVFSHGTESAGLAPIERWQALSRRGRRGGRLIGVDETRYPKDFGVFANYHTEVQTIPARYPIPGPLSLEQLDAFLDRSGDRYAVQWLEHAGAGIA